MTYTPVMTKVVTESNQVDWVPGDEEVRFSGNVVWCGGLSTAWMSSDFKCAPIAQMDDGLIRM